MKTATEPFQFSTAASLTRIANEVAGNLSELADGLGQCSDASIFYHTFQTLGSHHFLTEGFSNDFAQWVLTATNRGEVAEQLVALDVRDYLSLSELRSDLRRVVGDYCSAYPQISKQEALQKFYFCEGTEVTLPMDVVAHTLSEFREGLKRLSHDSFYFHFISSRLRLQLRTNDFSLWFANSLGLESLAYEANRIDIYTNTLDGARSKLLRLVDREMEP